MDQRHRSPRSVSFLARAVLEPLERFLHVEAASGLVLLATTALALAWANSPWAPAYDALWHTPFTIGVGSLVADQPLHFWINDGLMTLFFLLVGLEIRRELHEGALSSWRLATLPVAAALGGVLVPALLYLTLNAADPALRQGWAVPTATDIAFAVGVLALLGRRIPAPLRVMLLALAIIDDIVAVVVIAVFYSKGITFAGLLIAAAGVGCVLAFQRLGIRSALAYVFPGAVVWFGLLYAGVHPTLAGVVLGLLTPAVTPASSERLLSFATGALDELKERTRRPGAQPRELVAAANRLKHAQRELLVPVVRVEAAIHPWVAYGIMPLFAFANAGVSFDLPTQGIAGAHSVAFGIAIALLLGKPLGILAGTALVLRAGLAELAPGVNWRGLFVMACLGGIGFTMSIFIANLAFFDANLLASAKLGILGGSAAAALAGLAAGWIGLREPAPSLASDTEVRK